jgi:hypothetical protein
MELKHVLTPWNWFKKEEEQTSQAQHSLPVTRDRQDPPDSLSLQFSKPLELITLTEIPRYGLERWRMNRTANTLCRPQFA